MKTIAFFNSKGGAGKSTLAVHAGVCAAYDQATALLDADPQGTLQTWSKKRHWMRRLSWQSRLATWRRSWLN